MKDFKYVDVIDLPTDPSGTLGNFRTGLLKAYNYNRQSPAKLQLLGETLTTIVNAINEGMETPDSIDMEAFRRYQIDKEIKNTPVSAGFIPMESTVKPKRAAKRTPTKRAKRTTQKAK